MKVIDKAKILAKKSVGSIMNERNILVYLCPLNNPFIVNIKGAFQDR